jgi:hypothetical protein
VIDDFFEDPISLAREFPAKDDPCWFRYDNPLEVKQTCNDWHHFKPETYKAFSNLLSPGFNDMLQRLTGAEVEPDLGLHGGGLHQHGRGGKLNVHLDYNLHPKLHLQRRLNLIVYLTPGWKPEWGGHLGLYKDPDTLVKAVEPKFNRAIIFDTRGSWHGLPAPLTCPEDVTRNSFAIYYLCEPTTTDSRSRALFAPTAEQKGNTDVDKLIRQRSM